MKEDRKVDATINMLAQQTAKGDLTDPGKTCLSLVIDGMDENKFKIPKRVEATKQLAALWRPECRFIGCLAEGLTENFFIGDCNLVKDANMDLTIVAHVLHEAQMLLQERGVALPSVLRLHSDNASSELKNQLTMKFCSWIIHRELFKEIHLTQFRVGHSHGKIDQRFSECRGILADSSNVETPAQFLEALRRVKPREGRSLNLGSRTRHTGLRCVLPRIAYWCFWPHADQTKDPKRRRSCSRVHFPAAEKPGQHICAGGGNLSAVWSPPA